MVATLQKLHRTTKFANLCKIVNSLCPPSSKFCNTEFRLSCTPQARRKKAQCYDGIFAMVTICENLQKLISTFFSASSKTKKSVVSWWRIRDGHHSRNFAKMNFDFLVRLNQDEKKRSVMMAFSLWSPFAKFCKNELQLFSQRQANHAFTASAETYIYT